MIVPSSSFRETLPVKPSVKQLAALDVAAELEPALGQEPVRLERELVALLRLLPDREQADVRLRPVEDLLGEDRAHVRELEQVLGAGIGVRPRVDQHRGTPPGGDDDRDPRPQDAGDPAEDDQAGSEHRAGVARRDNGIGVTLGDRAAGEDERALRLAANGLRGLLVHRDRLGRLDEVEPVGLQAGGAVQDRDDPVGRRFDRPRDDLVRPAVASHGVDRNPGWSGEQAGLG